MMFNKSNPCGAFKMFSWGSKKRGQLTLFVIAAVVIVIVVVGYFMVQNMGGDEGGFEKKSFSEQVGVVRESVLDCFEGVYEDSLTKVGMQGGYYGEPFTYYLMGYDNYIPFYYFGNLTYIPDESLIEEELVYAFDVSKEECFDLISSEYGLEYDYSYDYSDVIIEEDGVTFVTNVLLSLKKEGQVSEVDFFKTQIMVPSKIKDMNAFASYIALSHAMNDGSTAINAILEIALDRGFDVEMDMSEDEIMIVYITDNRMGDFPEVYIFAMANFLTGDDVLSSVALGDDFDYIYDGGIVDDELNVSAPGL